MAYLQPLVGTPKFWFRMPRAQILSPESRVSVTPSKGTATEIMAERNTGLFRAFLAGPGRTLMEAFANLERAPGVQILLRHPQRRLVGARVSIPPEEGEGTWEFTRIGEEIYVIIGNFAYRTSRVELVPGDGLIQFYFKLSGDLTLAINQTEPLRLNRPSLLVYFQPPGIELREWTAASSRERFIAINIRAEYLVEQFLSSPSDLPLQLRVLLASGPKQFAYCQIPLSSRMFDLASRLIENPYNGALALIQTEAITLELLCAAVAEFTAAPQTRLEPYSEHDLRRLHVARNFLMRQLSPVPTIRQVARAAGMNETSLKRGFKAVFGETLFDFSVACRMRHALMLLRERRLLVARVAEAVGYSHQTSFATAFRRHFGVSPKDARGLKST